MVEVIEDHNFKPRLLFTTVECEVKVFFFEVEKIIYDYQTNSIDTTGNATLGWIEEQCLRMLNNNLIIHGREPY